MTAEFEQSEHAGPQPQNGPEQQSIEQAVVAAMGGLSIDELLAQVTNHPQRDGAGSLDPSRPVRGGRPKAASANDPETLQSPEPREQAESPEWGRIKHGKVVAIQKDGVFVDLGGKSQGIVPLEQFRPADPDIPQTPVAPGQEYDFVYAGYDEREGLVLLSRPGAVNHGGWEQLHEGDVVQAQVTGANKGGLEVKVNNIRAFMPAGQVDVKFTADLNSLAGQKITCRIMQVDRGSKRLIVSRRVIREEEIAQLREKTWSRLATGQILQGVVSSVQPYGAFVDIGGVEGLLHVSAMSYTRVTDPGKIVKPGDTIQVMVLAIDQEKQRVSLGLKQLQEDPWARAIDAFPIGSAVRGKVTRLMDFGAFVELAPGAEGLIHVSEVANKRVGHPKEVLEIGQEVVAKVLAVEPARQRISLSIAQQQRQAAAPPAGGPTPPPVGPKPVAAQKRPLKGGL